MSREYLNLDLNKNNIDWKKLAEDAKKENEEEGAILAGAIAVMLLLRKLGKDDTCLFAVSLVLSALTGKLLERPSDLVEYLYKALNEKELNDLVIGLTLANISSDKSFKELLELEKDRL